MPLPIAMDHVARSGPEVHVRFVTVEDGQPYTLPFVMTREAAADLARRLGDASKPDGPE